MNITCNICGKNFELEQPDIIERRIDDLDIQYYVCPHCRKKYVVFAADIEMRGLILLRKEYERKIRAGVLKKFRKKAIAEWISKNDEMKARQRKMLPGLKKRAAALLEKADEQ